MNNILKVVIGAVVATGAVVAGVLIHTAINKTVIVANTEVTEEDNLTAMNVEVVAEEAVIVEVTVEEKIEEKIDVTLFSLSKGDEHNGSQKKQNKRSCIN